MNRNLTLAWALVFVFLVSALVLSAILPGPHKPTDYLVIGGISTMVCLGVLFLVVVVAPGKKRDKGQASRTSTDL